MITTDDGMANEIGVLVNFYHKGILTYYSSK